MVRLASARTPGSKRFVPVRSAASMSMVPTTRSSEALMGSSTTRMRRLWEGRMPAAVRGGRAPGALHRPLADYRREGEAVAAERDAHRFRLECPPAFEFRPV